MLFQLSYRHKMAVREGFEPSLTLVNSQPHCQSATLQRWYFHQDSNLGCLVKSQEPSLLADRSKTIPLPRLPKGAVGRG